MKARVTLMFLLGASGTEPAVASPFAKVFAAGLTYKKHISDSAEKIDPKGPVIFVKNPRTVLRAVHSQSVAIPTEKLVYERLDFLKPGLASEVRAKFDSFPMMLDYEGELGILITRALTKTDLLKDSLENSVAFFSANDLSLRSVQILGDQQPNKLDYWSTAKSFSGFLPYSDPARVKTFSLSHWPLLTIRTLVNGEVRQQDTTADIVKAYTPRAMLTVLLQKSGGDSIPAGTALLTGTPSGTALKINRFKKFLGGVLRYSPVKKLDTVAEEALKNPDYLKVGDEVVVEIPGVGANRIVITK